MKTIENILATVTLAKSVLETWPVGGGGGGGETVSKCSWQSSNVAKEVAGGLNGFGRYSNAKELTALVLCLVIGQQCLQGRSLGAEMQM